jgi:hypothetical protein
VEQGPERVSAQGYGESKDTLDKHGAAFANTGGDLWFHTKSDSAADASSAHDIIETHLKDAISEPPIVVRAEQRDGTWCKRWSRG